MTSSLRVVLIFAISCFCQRAFSCSSCGSGAAAPIFLQPNESYKLYIGHTTTTRFRDILTDGSLARHHGLERQESTLVSAGVRINRESFVSLSLPYTVNHSNTHQIAGFGDTALSARITLIQQEFTKPWVPQIQILANTKAATARSPATSRHSDLLDAMGNGHHEVGLGVDVWFAMFPVLWGLSSSYSHAFEREVADILQQPGAGLTQIFTLGYQSNLTGKLLTGLIYLDQGERVSDHKRMPNSKQTRFSHFMTWEKGLSGHLSLRLNLLRGGVQKSKNSSRSDSFTLSLMVAGL